MEAEEAGDPEAPSIRPKAIAIFSDGTGNSSAKLFKTNVWRMYEAVELDETGSGREQIVFYDEGVGNSWIRPLAALGAVFGIGLKTNVLDLYRFVCRNYDAARGDEIYAFGFSRGGFTIRMLIGLINKEGLVPYRGEADLAHQSADAFRSYLRGRNPRHYPMRALVPAWRELVRGLLRLWRSLRRQSRYDRAENTKPVVRFVGVWDTVAAYGGPITEIVRAFDDWIRPLTFKDRKLPDIVQVARHALALDDERDAFHPVPWDEPHGTDPERLQQVWFAGMHADVGGGYPDDSLAYVSLAWMMKEARAAGLLLRPEKVAETGRVANAYGPIHDSRSGLGSYYRYQPRNIGAYIEPPAPGTESMRDPEFEHQGLAACPRVDESVLCRIAAGVDGYAPITLPGRFQVVGASPHRNRLPGDLQQKLNDTAAKRAVRQEAIRDLVWWRRLLYFLIVAATAGLVMMAFIPEGRFDPLCGDSRCYLGPMFGWLRGILPNFAEPWIVGFERFAGITLTLIALIFVFRALGGILERSLRDRTRRLWKQSLQGNITEPPMCAPVRRIRNSAWYQLIAKALKWRVLPTMIGLAMLLAIVFGLLTLAGQVRLALGENADLFCSGQTAETNILATSETCNRLGIEVTKGASYEVNLYVTEPWKDGAQKTGPLGLEFKQMTIGHWLGIPFRRVVAARYMQPLIEIELPRKERLFDRYRRVHIRRLQFERVGKDHYRATFQAPREGTLSIFVNEAVPPFFGPTHFYKGSERTRNSGAACVAVARLADDGERVPMTRCPQDQERQQQPG